MKANGVWGFLGPFHHICTLITFLYICTLSSFISVTLFTSFFMKLRSKLGNHVVASFCNFDTLPALKFCLLTTFLSKFPAWKILTLKLYSRYVFWGARKKKKKYPRNDQKKRISFSGFLFQVFIPRLAFSLLFFFKIQTFCFWHFKILMKSN